MPVTDWEVATDMLDAAGSGSIERTDLTVLSGTLLNIESEYDDPQGIGCVMMRGKDGSPSLVFRDEFSALTECPLGKAV